MPKLYDIVIVGGGFASLSLANALRHMSLSIAIIESKPLPDFSKDDPDGRCFALSKVSKRFFETIGCWPEGHAIGKIKSLQVSQKGWFSCTRIHAPDLNLEALGYLVPARLLMKSLFERAASLPNVDIYTSCNCEQVDYLEDYAELSLQQSGETKSIRARLVIAADGAESFVRHGADIEVKRHDYQQSAIVTKFQLNQDHEDIAYERFTQTGPMAVLPLPNKQASLVWTSTRSQIEELMSLSNNDFITQFQQEFGYRLGKISHLGKRLSYPIKLVVAKNPIKPRLAVIGNAAQSLHPVAGQGLNLGLRDVAILAETIFDADRLGKDIASIDVLQRFADNRASRQKRIIGFTDFLAKWFMPNSFLLPMVRDLGLGILNIVSPVRSRFLKMAMGAGDKLPRLMCGIELAPEAE